MGGNGSKKLVPNRPIPKPLVQLPERNPPKESLKLVPPDGGWGWMVVLGACLSFIFFPAMTVAFGVMFRDRLEQMGASATSFTLIGNGLSTSWSFVALFAAPLSELFGQRRVTIVGGLLSFLAMILSAYSTSLISFGLSYSLIGGIAGSLSTFNGFTIVPLYFSKRKGLANGFVCASSALGKIAMAPLVRYLLDTYGYKWACLIVAALSLHTCVAGMLYQPPSWHQVLEKDDCEILDISMPGASSGGGGAGGTEREEKSGSPSTNRQKYERLRSKIHEDAEDEEVIFSVSGSCEPPRSVTAVTTTARPSPRANDDDDEEVLFNRDEGRKSYPSRRERTLSAEASLSWAGSLDMLPPVETKVFEDDEGRDGGQKTCCDDFIVVKVFKMLNYSLLRDPKFHLVAWPNALSIMGYLNSMYALPGYIATMGYTPYQAAFAISVFSIMEVVCRLAFAALSDFSWFPIQKAYISGLVLSAVSMAALTLVPAYGWILFWVGVNGVALSLTSVLLIHLMILYLGKENYAQVIGFCSILNGLFLIFGGFVVGLTRDHYGSYNSVFYILTVFIGIAAVIWISWVAYAFSRSKYTNNSHKDAA